MLTRNTSYTADAIKIRREAVSSDETMRTAVTAWSQQKRRKCRYITAPEPRLGREAPGRTAVEPRAAGHIKQDSIGAAERKQQK